MTLTKKAILIISPEPWDHIFVSKHHYANTLARLGNKVYFLNPPSHQDRVVEDNGVYVIDYKNKFPGIHRLPPIVRDVFMRIQVKALARHWDHLDVVWSFDPFRFQRLDVFNADVKIYHAVDVHTTTLEYEIANNADYTFFSSKKLLESIETQKPKFFVNHGLASHFLDHDFTYHRGENITVGYMGNLGYKYLDVEVIVNIVKSHPEVRFEFIGPYIDSDLYEALKTANNCLFTGKIDSKDLPKALDNMDLFVMSYKCKDNPATLANPHKILEYLSTGRVIISHYIDEYKDLDDLVVMAEDNPQLPALFSKVLTRLEFYNSPELVTARKNLARSNSYEEKIQFINKVIS